MPIMATEPRISVVLPVYNGGPYIDEAVQSILDQTFPDFELIVIDDGSSDDSAERIARFDDPRLRFVENERNIGLIETLNKGLGLARGAFIARMDQDDIALPHRFERQIAFMQSHPGVGVCGSHVVHFGVGDERPCRYPIGHEAIRCRLLFGTAFAHPSVMMRASMLRDNGLAYDPAHPHAEDYGLWVRCMDVCGLANIDEPLLRYRLHAENTVAVFGGPQRRSVERIHRGLLARLGVTPDEDALDLHFRLAYRPEFDDPEGLGEVESWLVGLREANERAGLFDEAVLSDCLEGVWFRACRSLPAEGIRGVLRFVRSPLVDRWRRDHWLDALRLAVRSVRGPAGTGANAVDDGNGR